MADQVQQAAGAISYLQGSMIICELVPGYQEARQAGVGVVMLMLVPGNQQALMHKCLGGRRCGSPDACSLQVSSCVALLIAALTLEASKVKLVDPCIHHVRLWSCRIQAAPEPSASDCTHHA